MSCTHHKGGRCTNQIALPLYGDTPSPGVCRICPHHAGAPRGLGDVVHWLAKVTGLARLAPRCLGCERRRQRLNGAARAARAAPASATPAQKSRGCNCSG
jgi:hypothetical protein